MKVVGEHWLGAEGTLASTRGDLNFGWDRKVLYCNSWLIAWRLWVKTAKGTFASTRGDLHFGWDRKVLYCNSGLSARILWVNTELELKELFIPPEGTLILRGIGSYRTVIRDWLHEDCGWRLPELELKEDNSSAAILPVFLHILDYVTAIRFMKRSNDPEQKKWAQNSGSTFGGHATKVDDGWKWNPSVGCRNTQRNTGSLCFNLATNKIMV